MKTNQIKILAKRRKLPIRAVFNHLNMTEGGFNKMLKRNSCKVDTLEKIANFFEVPISIFFDEKKFNDTLKAEDLIEIKRELREKVEELAKMRRELLELRKHYEKLQLENRKMMQDFLHQDRVEAYLHKDHTTKNKITHITSL